MNHLDRWLVIANAPGRIEKFSYRMHSGDRGRSAIDSAFCPMSISPLAPEICGPKVSIRQPGLPEAS